MTFTENHKELKEDMGNAFQIQLDAVREYLDLKLDSHAPIAGVENITETTLSVDKEEEATAKAKETDFELAQRTPIEKDTSMAENASTNIIHKGEITTVGTEMNHRKNEKTEDEAKEGGQVAEEDGITISHKSSRNDQSTKRLHRYTSQQPRAKATTAASITTFITTKYKHATDPRSAKLKQLLKITEGKEE